MLNHTKWLLSRILFVLSITLPPSYAMEERAPTPPQTLDAIPPELVLVIFQNMTLKDLQSMSLANNKFNYLACKALKQVADCKPIMRNEKDWEKLIELYNKSLVKDDSNPRQSSINALFQLASEHKDTFDRTHNTLQGYIALHYLSEAFFQSRISSKRLDPQLSKEIAKTGLKVTIDLKEALGACHNPLGDIYNCVISRIGWLNNIINRYVDNHPKQNLVISPEELSLYETEFNEFLEEQGEDTKKIERVHKIEKQVIEKKKRQDARRDGFPDDVSVSDSEDSDTED